MNERFTYGYDSLQMKFVWATQYSYPAFQEPRELFKVKTTNFAG